jgi:hypothetical protein
MSRKDKLILQFILWLALGTFLFGVWAMAVGFRKSPAPLDSTTNPVAPR